MEGTAQAYGRLRRRNLPRAVKRGPASQPIRRGAKPSPPPSHKIFSGTGAFYSPINGRERGREGLVACQTVLNEDMSSFQVCFQGLVTTMHPRKTITSLVAFVSHRSFQHFRSLREALPSQPDRRKHSRRGRREVLLSEKGLGKFTPPRQPALEELVIQVKDKLEKLPGGLLLRKPPRGELPP